MATYESLVLGGVELNDDVTFGLESLEMPPPSKKQDWATGADADGGLLVRDPLFENRTITIRVRVAQQSTMDLALTSIGTLVQLLEETENLDGGMTLVWTPANSTKSLTAYVLSGEVTGVPITSVTGDDFGWLIRWPVLTIRLDCKPHLYGASTTVSLGSSATPYLAATITGVTGDVPAEAVMTITDAAAQSRRYMEWGLEQRYYNAATSNLVDSDNLVTTGFSGAGGTRTGAYDPNATGNNVVTTTLTQMQPVACCGLGDLSHVGTFRVKARVQASTADQYLRLAWRDGDGPLRGNPWVTPVTSAAWVEVDLGIISISPAVLGTQRWTGQVEAYQTTGAGGTLDVDYLLLIPAGEGYGRARSAWSYAAGALRYRDDFNGIADGTALSTRAAPLGGSWTTSGSATDFVANAADGTERRLTASESAPGRVATVGVTARTDTEVQIRSNSAGTVSGSSILSHAVARWVDNSNFLCAGLNYGTSTLSARRFEIRKVITGTETVVRGITVEPSPSAWYTSRLIAYASGRVIAQLLDINGQVLSTIEAFVAEAATGGTLASGRPGFRDLNTSASTTTRLYDNFYEAAPAAEPIVMFSGRQVEVRQDGFARRQDSTGTYWGTVPLYRGARFLVPAAGSANRTSRVVVKAHRNDIEAGESANVTDSISGSVTWTPRYVVAPR